MKTISVEQKRKVDFFPVNNCVIEEKGQYSSLEEFLNGSISGKELVKYVCDRLDEKYVNNRSCGI